MQQKNSIQRLQNMPLPQQTLGQLSFCENKVSAVRNWAERLPITHISATAAALYKLLPELARLNVKATERLEMLEAIRPAMQQINLGLAKEFLNKPIILPERAHKAATISQALQKHMVNGYLVVVRDLLSSGKKIKKDVESDLAKALHRAMTGMGRMMLRSFQLYVPMNLHFWEQLHNLYHIAEEYNLLQLPIQDPSDNQSSNNTSHQTYLRLLMLASACPNRLRQSELEMLYSSLEYWTNQVQINPLSGNSLNLFAVDLNSDSGPFYKRQIKNPKEGFYREIDTSKLLNNINQKFEQRSAGQKVEGFHLPHTLGDNLIRHLLNVWSVQPQRTFPRSTKEGAISVLVGMGCLHFHLADRTPLENFIGHEGASSMLHRNNSNQLNRFMDSGKNAWDHAMDAGTSNSGLGSSIEFDESPDQIDYSERYPINTAQQIDSSPNGYCLEWRQRIPTQVRTGEVLGLKEAGRGFWSIGVIRWLSQSQGSTRCGVELLSPNASPYAAYPLDTLSDGEPEYFRIFLLPAVPALKKNATILTPNLPFQENSKVRLNLHGQEQTVMLQKRIYHTSSISLFEFRNLEDTDDNSITNDEAKTDSDDFSDILDDL